MTVDLPSAGDTKINMENGYDNPVLLQDVTVDKSHTNLALNNKNVVSYNSVNEKPSKENLSSIYVIPPPYTSKPTNGYNTNAGKNSLYDKNNKEKDAYANGINGKSQSMKTLSNNNKNCKEYEPYDHIQRTRQPTTYLDTMFHLLKASLGTGILAMPNAFYNAGYAVGTIGTLCVGLLCTYSIHMLISAEYELCKRKRVPFMTYAETVEAAFEEGPKRLQWFAPYARLTTDMFLVAYQVGTSAIYVVFMASNFKNIYDTYTGNGNSPENGIDIRLMMLYILLPLVLICLVPNLKLLVPFSTVANFVTMLSFVFIFYYVFKDIPSIKTVEPIGPISRLPLFFGTVLFAMEAIGMIMPLKNEMAKPKKFGSLFGVLNASMIPISLMYAVLGFFGYLKYGSKTQGSITLNLPNEELLANAVKLFYSLAIYISYALSCYVIYEIIWMNSFREKFKDSSKIVLMEYGARACIALFTFIMAAAIPKLDLFISFTGALCLSTTGIAFPAIVQTLVHWEYRHDKFNYTITIMKNFVLLLIAIFAFTIGISTSVVKFIEEM